MQVVLGFVKAWAGGMGAVGRDPERPMPLWRLGFRAWETSHPISGGLVSVSEDTFLLRKAVPSGYGDSHIVDKVPSGRLLNNMSAGPHP